MFDPKALLSSEGQGSLQYGVCAFLRELFSCWLKPRENHPNKGSPILTHALVVGFNREFCQEACFTSQLWTP